MDGAIDRRRHDEVVALAKRQSLDGAAQADVLSFLRQSGFPIVSAIRATREIYAIGLGDAKEVCVRSGLWQGEVDAAEPLHDALEQIAEMLSARAKSSD